MISQIPIGFSSSQRANMSYTWRRAPWMCFGVRICPSMENYTPAVYGVWPPGAASCAPVQKKHSLTALFAGFTIGLCLRASRRQPLPPQRVEKVRLRRPFPRFTVFPSRPFGPPGRETPQGNLAAQACESAAHVAGFGLHLEGFGPPNLPEGFFDSLRQQ